MMKDLTEIKFDPEHESTKDITRGLFKNIKKKYLFLVIFLVLLLLVFSVLTSAGFFVFFLHLIIPAFVIYLFIYGYYYSIALGRFFKKFAEVNGLSYEKTASLNSVSGKLFSMGRRRKISHVVSGYFDNHPIRSFIYRYTVGSGKNSRTYHFTVWEIEFEKTEFPHILLRSLDMPRYKRKKRGEEKVGLRDEFSDKFELYIRRGYQVEALQIFTPEVLRMLSEKGSNFSIEFAGRSLYIYDDTVVGNKKNLKEMFDVARSVFDKTGPLINRLHDDFEVMHKYYAEKG